MHITVFKERHPFEQRVAATPDTVRAMKAMGADVSVEKDAGLAAGFTNEAFEKAGASISAGADLAALADIVLNVQRPQDDELSALKPGAKLIGMLSPYAAHGALKLLAEKRVDAFSLELMPRITRAQGMDVLSSQANLAGYRAVIEATAQFHRAFPMMMTAAGTIAPARVLVMGAGVAGLQAIATAKRLGAIVSANDVRLAAKEQVESLGATFLMVQDEESKQAETAGGYAKEMSESYKAKQAALVAETIKKQDVVICTALIPGKPAPRLITTAMLQTMRPGSVIIDMAAEQGGNCEGSKAGETVERFGIKIVGVANLSSCVASDASMLYAKNVLNFLGLVLDKSANLCIDWNDEI
ncbi:MAG TPA: Re/Si-specific NAD(P)(+) transhydrogenase subunit alpha, partial [Alphaproteobacteria bacterium]|nr:Re/Si-specific NAD(P)(+) transhydrogenase subunit alpha [Alphaproteobacteria bacterium]